MSRALHLCATLLVLAFLPAWALAQQSRPSSRPADSDSKAEQQVASLVIMLSAPRELDEKVLKRQVERALDIKLPGPGDEETRDFLVVRASNAILKRAGRLYMIRSDPRPVPTKFVGGTEEVQESRARRAFEAHKAVLHLFATIDPAGEKELREEISLLAKVASELLQEDSLALSFSTDPNLLVVDEKTKEHLRSADPVNVLRHGAVHPPVVGVGDQDAEMNAAIAEARKTWPRFVEWFRKHGGESAHAKWPVSEKDKTEHLWVRVTRIEGDTVHGVIGNEPVDVKRLKLGEKVSFPASVISDWLYLEDGKMRGGYTVEVLRKRAEKK